MRYRILVNHAARNGADERWLGIVRSAFNGRDHDILIPGSLDAMRRAARETVEDGIDVVVVVGGDGSLNVVANQLAHSGTAMAAVPAGTANDLARQLGMPLTPYESCRAILTGEKAHIDLGLVNGHYFLTGGGTGIVSRVAIGVHKLKSRAGFFGALVRSLGSAAYPLYSAWLLLTASDVPQTLSLRVDGTDLGERDALALFIHNQPAIGRTVMACPLTRPTDGTLGYCRIGWQKRARSLWILAMLNRDGAHALAEEVELGEGTDFVLTAAAPLDFMADGEVLTQASSLRISTAPGGLRVIVPVGATQFQTPSTVPVSKCT
jgi:YegS/Rv2252/BmrU family lipid kinase